MMNDGSPCGRDLVIHTREEARNNAHVFHSIALWSTRQSDNSHGSIIKGGIFPLSLQGICHSSLMKKRRFD